MPLGTQESTLHQDFLRGQTSSGVQTVRLTRDTCHFPHSQKTVNSIVGNPMARTHAGGISSVSEKRFEYNKFWGVPNLSLNLFFKRSFCPDVSVGKDSWCKAWQHEFGPQSPHCRRESWLTGCSLTSTCTLPSQVNKCNLIRVLYLFETGSYLSSLGWPSTHYLNQKDT